MGWGEELGMFFLSIYHSLSSAITTVLILYLMLMFIYSSHVCLYSIAIPIQYSHYCVILICQKYDIESFIFYISFNNFTFLNPVSCF